VFQCQRLQAEKERNTGKAEERYGDFSSHGARVELHGGEEDEDAVGQHRADVPPVVWDRVVFRTTACFSAGGPLLSGLLAMAALRTWKLHWMTFLGICTAATGTFLLYFDGRTSCA